MDAGIADTINRQTADAIAKQLDLVDWFDGVNHRTGTPWYRGPLAEEFLKATDMRVQSWVYGLIAHRAVYAGRELYSLIPADADYENLFSALRVEITMRRGTEIPRGDAAEVRVAEVV